MIGYFLMNSKIMAFWAIFTLATWACGQTCFGGLLGFYFFGECSKLYTELITTVALCQGSSISKSDEKTPKMAIWVIWKLGSGSLCYKNNFKKSNQISLILRRRRKKNCHRISPVTLSLGVNLHWKWLFSKMAENNANFQTLYILLIFKLANTHGDPSFFGLPEARKLVKKTP